MNILNLTIADFGGAGRGAKDINNKFNEMGFFSKLVVLEKKSFDDDVIEVNKFEKYKRKIKRIFYQTLPAKNKYQFYGFYEEVEYITAKSILKVYSKTPDVINIFWISNFVNTKTIKELHELTGASVVFHLPDMANFTGGCHFSLGCNQYTNSCINCPAITLSKYKNKPNQNIEIKQKNLKDINISIIAGTSEIHQKAKSSSLFKNSKIEDIGFFVDQNIFSTNQNIKLSLFKRQALVKFYEYFDIEFSSTNKILFFGAASFDQKRKGLHLLIDSIRLLKKSYKNNNLKIVYCGQQLPNEITTELNLYYLGSLNLKELAIVYKAVNGFLSPSIDDIGPFMVAESMFCSTPVVSFQIGIARDIVIDNETGYTTEDINSKSYAQKIIELLEDDQENTSRISKNAFLKVKSFMDSRTRMGIYKKFLERQNNFKNDEV